MYANLRQPKIMGKNKLLKHKLKYQKYKYKYKTLQKN